MATTFKAFSPGDINTTVTNLHESIPITASIVTGTYDEANIKNYPADMFQSVYDYPFLSSSANHIFDITVGYSSDCYLNDADNTQNTKKVNIYNEFSRVLVMPDATGSVQNFDTDGNFDSTSDKMTSCVFLPFSRLLVKDEIKKGSVQLTFLTGGAAPVTTPTTLYDAGAVTGYKVNSPAGEYGLLYGNASGAGSALGHVYYQAGVIVLTSSVFSPFAPPGGAETILETLATGSISGSAAALRHRVDNLQFNNTTELNSTIYFCRANSNEFNYSANPSYLSSSQIVVKNFNTDIPVSYATTVGLYSSDQELLAVAKISEPLKKDPTNELVLRVRLDY